MRTERTRLLVEIALTVALCYALRWIGVRLPWNIAGGSVSLEMLPLFVLGLRRGVVPAMVAGAMWGVVDFLFEPYVIGPVQVLLDYPVAFALVGLCGLGSGRYKRLVSAGRLLTAEIAAVPWMLLGAGARFAAHFVSGMVFFAENAPQGQPVWLYSLVYNASYLVPSAVMCVAAALVVLPVLQRAVPVTRDRAAVSGS